MLLEGKEKSHGFSVFIVNYLHISNLFLFLLLTLNKLMLAGFLLSFTSINQIERMLFDM